MHKNIIKVLLIVLLQLFLLIKINKNSFTITKKEIKSILSIKNYQIIKEIHFSWYPFFISEIAPGYRWGIWGFAGTNLIAIDLGITAEEVIKYNIFHVHPQIIFHYMSSPDKYGIGSTTRSGLSFGIKLYINVSKKFKPFGHVGVLLGNASGNNTVIEGFYFGGVFSLGMKYKINSLLYISPMIRLFNFKNPPDNLYYTAGFNFGIRI